MTNPFKQKTDGAKTLWYIWLFPVIALGICTCLFVDYFRQRGPTIKIYFDDASNIQAGKTHVRFRGVTIGIVKQMSISNDNKEVIASVDLQRDGEQFAVAGTKFWVVMPKVNFSGVSGPETLFEGPYIAVQPGKPDDNSKYEFIACQKSNTSGKGNSDAFATGITFLTSYKCRYF